MISVHLSNKPHLQDIWIKDFDTTLQSFNDGRGLYIISKVANVWTMYRLSLSSIAFFLRCISVERRNIGMGKGFGKSYVGGSGKQNDAYMYF